MESLRDAAQARKSEMERERVAAEARRQADEALWEEAERISNERALELVQVMQSGNVPSMYLYRRGCNPDVSRAEEEAPVRGWIARSSYTHLDLIQEGYVTINGIFVAEDGRTFLCDEVKSKGEVNYVTAAPSHWTLRTDESILPALCPTALRNDGAYKEVIDSLIYRGLV